MSWEIVVGLIALVGFIMTITTPILKLNTSINQLNFSIDSMRESLNRLDKGNTEQHKRLWDYNEKQDTKIKNHEKRINTIEKVMETDKLLHPDIFSYDDNNQEDNEQ